MWVGPKSRSGRGGEEQNSSVKYFDILPGSPFEIVTVIVQVAMRRSYVNCTGLNLLLTLLYDCNGVSSSNKEQLFLLYGKF
jgi:hypothetical protein